jgi:hypothetical protein
MDAASWDTQHWSIPIAFFHPVRRRSPVKIQRPVATAIFSLLVAVQFAVCDRSRAADADYFPVPPVGSQREYSIVTTNASGDLEKEKSTVRVVAEVEIKGHRYLKEATVISGIAGSPASINYLRYSKDGMYLIPEDDKGGPEKRCVPFPISVGKTWSYSQGASGLIRCKAESIEDVHLPGRIIKRCLEITERSKDYNGGDKTGRTYYAPGLGIVKVIAKFADKSTMEITLTQPVPN